MSRLFRIYLILSGFSLVFSSSGSVSGYVFDIDTNQPLYGANIFVRSLDIGSSCDDKGFFLIDQIPTGSYTIDISRIGYSSVSKFNVNVYSKRKTPITIYLESVAIEGAEIIASAGYFEKADDAVVSSQSIDREEIRSDPVGAYDLQMMLHSLPSVVTGTDQNNEIVVRGGGPSENLFLVDNIEIPNPNHFGEVGTGGGPVNIINTEFVERVDFFAGGFPARYGDKQSSVMDISLREGNYSEFDIDFELSMAGIGLLAEGPLFSKKISFISSYRKSFIDNLIKSAGLVSVPKYQNSQHKITYNINNNNKIIFNAIAGIDNIEIKDENRPELRGAENVSYSGYQYTLGLTYKTLFSLNGYALLSLGRTFSSWEADVYEYESTFVDTFFYRDNNEFDDFVKLDLVYKFNSRLKISSGISIKHGHYNINESLDADTLYRYTYPAIDSDMNLNNYNSYYDFIDSNPELADDITTFVPSGVIGLTDVFINNQSGVLWKYGGYSQIKINLHPLIITAGFRYDNVPYNQTSKLSPRFGSTVILSPMTKINFAIGQYCQTPSYWIFLNPYNANRLEHPYSNQVVLGIEHYLASDTRMTVEGYLKKIYNRPVRVSDISADPYDSVLGFDDIGTGESAGIELFVQKKFSDRWYGTLSYSYSNSIAKDYREDGEGSYPWDFNVPHSLTIVGGYKIDFKDYDWYKSYRNTMLFKLLSFIPFMPSDQFELSFRSRYSDGLPYTPMSFDFYQRKWFESSDSSLNSKVRDYYYRVDIMLLRRFNFNSVNLTTFIDIQNIFDRSNEWERVYFDDGTYQMSYQYKQIPVAGLIVEF